ncbi:MAG: hypothetical protein ACE5JR_12325 [Gemmatimonadota bacterium]
MRFNRIDRIILFGGAPLLARSAEALADDGYELFVFTSPRHAHEAVTPDGRRLEEVLASLGTPYWVTDDINGEKALPGLISSSTLGLGMGEAWSFGRELIDAFEGQLVDVMGIPLPRYRGGAHYSWMILAGERRMACNIQLINEEMAQAFHDSAAIVHRREYELGPGVRVPQDYFDAAVPAELEFIREFLALIEEGWEFELRFLDERQSLLFPRLKTAIHGWIDWSWSGELIERFICAFDRPYPGAGTFLSDRAVRLREARLVNGERLHPFQSGLVVRVNEDEGVVVATTSGLLAIRDVRSEEGEGTPAIVHGMRFTTPREVLERALREDVRYASTGVVPAAFSSNNGSGQDARDRTAAGG